MSISLRALSLAACAIISLTIGAAGSEADYKKAYAAAEAAESEAGALRNRWIPTETTLTEARKAAEARDFDRATAAAIEAEALAKQSIAQALHEKDAWKDLDIKP